MATILMIAAGARGRQIRVCGNCCKMKPVTGKGCRRKRRELFPKWECGR